MQKFATCQIRALRSGKVRENEIIVRESQEFQIELTSGNPVHLKIKTPIDRIRAIILIRPLKTDKQTNTLNW